MEEAVLVPGVPAWAGGSVNGGALPPAGGAGLGRGSQEVFWGPMASEGPGASPGGGVLVTEALRVRHQEQQWFHNVAPWASSESPGETD